MPVVTAKRIAIATLTLFVASVCTLSLCGRDFLKRLNKADATVEYVDLARQATEKRDYAAAQNFYKQALIFARQADPTGEDAAFVARNYAYFAYSKLKDRKLAHAIEAEARKAPY